MHITTEHIAQQFINEIPLSYKHLQWKYMDISEKHLTCHSFHTWLVVFKTTITFEFMTYLSIVLIGQRCFRISPKSTKVQKKMCNIQLKFHPAKKQSSKDIRTYIESSWCVVLKTTFTFKFVTSSSIVWGFQRYFRILPKIQKTHKITKNMQFSIEIPPS